MVRVATYVGVGYRRDYEFHPLSTYTLSRKETLIDLPDFFVDSSTGAFVGVDGHG